MKNENSSVKNNIYQDTSGTLFGRFASLVVRHRIAVFILTGIVTALSIYGMSKLVVETDLHKFFRQSSPFTKATDEVSNRFKGTTSINIIIEGEKEGELEDPSLLHLIEMLQDYIDKLPTIGKTVSVVDYLKIVNRTLHNNDPLHYALPQSKREVSQYLLVYSLADPEKTLDRYIDYEHKSAKVLLRTSTTSSATIMGLGKTIKEECTKLFPPEISCKITGDSYLVSETAQNIAHEILISFTTAGIAITIAMLWFFRSFKMGLVSMIPTMISIAYILGLMGLLGIQFNLGTSIVICVAIGIAVDNTIAYLVRYFYELKKTNHYLIRSTTGIKITEDQIKTIYTTSIHINRPIIVAAIAIFFGFMVLAFSQFVPIVWYGVLSAITTIIALVCELVLLPPLLAVVSI